MSHIYNFHTDISHQWNENGRSGAATKPKHACATGERPWRFSTPKMDGFWVDFLICQRFLICQNLVKKILIGQTFDSKNCHRDLEPKFECFRFTEVPPVGGAPLADGRGEPPAGRGLRSYVAFDADFIRDVKHEQEQYLNMGSHKNILKHFDKILPQDAAWSAKSTSC